MTGNVREWCYDYYGGLQLYRVLRGGSWYYHAINCRIMTRLYKEPDYMGNEIGFRTILPAGD